MKEEEIDINIYSLDIMTKRMDRDCEVEGCSNDPEMKLSINKSTGNHSTFGKYSMCKICIKDKINKSIDMGF